MFDDRVSRRWRRAGSALVIALAGITAMSLMQPTPVSAATHAALVDAAEPDAIPGRYIVVVKGVPGTALAGSTSKAVSTRAQTAGVKVDRRYGHALNGFSAQLTSAQLQTLRSDPDVSYIAADLKVTLSGLQNASSWGLDRIDQRSLPLDNSYSWGSSGAGVTAYVIDSGIRSTHSEFAGRMLPGFSALGGSGSTEDCLGHGTHVAGTIGGAKYGVAKAVKLVPVRVFGCSIYGSTSDIIAGVDWVTANHALRSVANMSLGGPRSTAMDEAVIRSIQSGVTYAIAAGNDSADACSQSPARVPAAITVGATRSDDSMDTDYSNFGSCVDLFAPGTSITSAWYTADTATSVQRGTSMATPHVAGAAAILIEQNPSASPATIAAKLLAATTPNVLSKITSTSPNRMLYSVVPASDTTIGTYRGSDRTFRLRNTNTAGSPDVTAQFGSSGDKPIAGDWNGDGTTTIGVFRPSDNTFRLRNANAGGNADVVATFGSTGDIPIVGDWDGNGTTTIGVFRPSDKTFRLRNANAGGNADLIIPFGASGDEPIVGDWDGNGTTTIGVFRKTDNTFRLRNANASGSADVVAVFGSSGDKPIAGDWNGDGTTTIGVFRPSDNTFRLRNANAGGNADLVIAFGINGDEPIVGDWDGA